MLRCLNRRCKNTNGTAEGYTLLCEPAGIFTMDCYVPDWICRDCNARLRRTIPQHTIYLKRLLSGNFLVSGIIPGSTNDLGDTRAVYVDPCDGKAYNGSLKIEDGLFSFASEKWSVSLRVDHAQVAGDAMLMHGTEKTWSQHVPNP